MGTKQIITVFGATGAQGGGLVRSILEDRDGPFTVRAVTRDGKSDAARALAAAVSVRARCRRVAGFIAAPLAKRLGLG